MNNHYKNITYKNGDEEIQSFLNIIDEDIYLSDEYYFDVDDTYIDREGNIQNSPTCWNPITGELYEVVISKENSRTITYKCFDTELNSSKIAYTTDLTSFNTFSNYLNYTISSNLLLIILLLFFASSLILILNHFYFKTTKKLLSKIDHIYIKK